MTTNRNSGAAPGRRAVTGDSGDACHGCENGKPAAVCSGPKRGIFPRVTVLAALVAVLIGAGTGTAVAFWSLNAATEAGTITSGDLWISVGEMAWEQVTPGVINGASGVLSASPADFLSMPGDVIEIRVPVTTFLRGDNLVADMTIDCGAAVLSDDISATFHIDDAGGNQVSPPGGNTPVEQPLTIHGLLGADTGTTAQWTVVIDVEVLGDYRWVTPQSSDPGIGWSAGTVHATLEQVRSAPPSPSEGPR